MKRTPITGMVSGLALALIPFADSGSRKPLPWWRGQSITSGLATAHPGL